MARRRAAGLDALVLGALLLALAGLAAWSGAPDGAGDGEDAPAPIRSLLVDLSASVTRGRPAAAIELVGQLEDQARAAELAGEQVLLVTFARDATRRFGPGEPEAFLESLRSGGAEWLAGPDEDLASDLAAAAAVASSVVTASERPPGHVVLLGDGRWTGEDPGPLLLGAGLGDFEWVEPGPRTLPDAELVRLRVPERVEPGVAARVDVDVSIDAGERPPLNVVWRLWATSTDTLTRGTNREELVGEGSVPVGSDVPWARTGAGRLGTSIALALPALGQGTARIEVSVTCGGGDVFPENDAAAATWQIGDPLRVLVVASSGAEEDASRLAGLFVGRPFEGIEFTPQGLAGLERRLGEEPRPDVVMTFGTGVLGLPQAALADFVTSGGGYVHWAGWSRLVADDGPLSQLLVLEPDVEPREPRDIVFLVDGSGSMKGARWIRAKSALGRLLPSVPARDRFELRFFTQILLSPSLSYESNPGAGPAATEASRREALGVLRDIEVPGGSTDITGAVSQLTSRLEEAAEGVEDPRSSLVVLLTDGVPTLTGEPPARVRERLLEGGHELVVIQVGKRGPTRTLRGLAGGADNVVRAGELEDVLGILQEAVQGTTLVEGAEARARGSVPPALAELVSSARDAAGLSDPLVIGRALPCRVVDGAAGLLELEPAEPEGRRGALAAVAHRGAGTVAGVALPLIEADGARWAPRMEGRLAWIAPILRAAGLRAAEARAALEPEPTPSAAIERRAGEARIVLRGGDLAIGWRVPARLRPLGGPVDLEASIELVADGSGAWTAPRPELFDASPRGAAHELIVDGMSVFLASDGPAELHAGPARAAEVRGWVEARESVAAVTDPEEGPEEDPGRGPHPVAAWLLVAGALALFVGASAGR